MRRPPLLLLLFAFAPAALADFPSYAVTIRGAGNTATFAAVADGSAVPWKVERVVETVKACGLVEGAWRALVTRSAVGVQGSLSVAAHPAGMQASVLLSDTRLVPGEKRSSPCGEISAPSVRTTTWSQTFTWPADGGRGYIGDYEVLLVAI